MSQRKTRSHWEQYQVDGFFIQTDPIIPLDLVQQASQGMDQLREGHYETGSPPHSSYWSPGDDPKKLCKIEMPQFANRAIMDLVSYPAIGELAAELTGAEWVQVWWVQLLGKPPADPDAQTNIGWHQDRNYWGSWEQGSQLFTAWVAVSDVAVDCGPMKFLRGSSTWGVLEGSDFYGQNHQAQQSAIQVPEGEKWEEVAAILPPGGVSFHDNLTFHGSGPNLSNNMRRSFAIHLRTEKSRPVDGKRQGLTARIDDYSHCPVIYGEVSNR